ncbi:MAG: metallophosphoesterase [Clostridia bacterium]|nr:metallophosphoesterase [Clostridia bacterium]
MATAKIRRSNAASRARMTVLTLIALIVIASLISTFLSVWMLKPKYYTVKLPKITRSVRIVQLSDLYGHSFGNENDRLLTAVGILKPDIIAVTGDMFFENAGSDQIDLVCGTLTKLNELAPVYYTLGDQERNYIAKDGDGVVKKIKATGTKILDFTYEDIRFDREIVGQSIRIGGAYGMFYKDNVTFGSEQKFMQDFTKTDLPTILITHDGTGLLNYGNLKKWDVDVTLSGHTLGGIIRVPVAGGLFGINGQFFSDYSKGMFTFEEESGTKTAIVCAGLSSDRELPMRFNNFPDLVCVDIERALEN